MVSIVCVDPPPFATAPDPSPAHSASPLLQHSPHLHDQAITSVPDDFPIPTQFPIQAASVTSLSGLGPYESAFILLPQVSSLFRTTQSLLCSLFLWSDP